MPRIRIGACTITIAECLADEIVSGALAPGAALDETRLAKRFEVSRTPVREAIRLLVAKHVGQAKQFFTVENYRVIIERHGADLWAEATVKLRVTVALNAAGREAGIPANLCLKSNWSGDFDDVGAEAENHAR